MSLFEVSLLQDGSNRGGSSEPILAKCLFLILLVLCGSILWMVLKFGKTSEEQPLREFLPRAEIVKRDKACHKSEDRSACESQRKALLAIHETKLREIEKKYGDLQTSISVQLKVCRKMKMKEAVSLHQIWKKNAAKWWNDVLRYAQQGGKSPGWEPPPVPKACLPNQPQSAAGDSTAGSK